MKSIVVTIISALSLSALVPLAQADDSREMKTLSEGLGLISLEEAKTKALEARPGVIEDADLEDRDFTKGWDYEFEIVDVDGNEWEVYIDAKTGEVRKIEKDWF
jgi:uncharacterized membrane protein YkoI